MAFILPLHVLHREVHRFRGVVDRFGSFRIGDETIHTLCIRQLHHARSNRPVLPSHWWFRLREGWTMAGIQPGDEVIFTAKVHRCSKGLDQNGHPNRGDGHGRRQVIGLTNRVRDVVVSRRVFSSSTRLERLKALEMEVKALRLQLGHTPVRQPIWLMAGRQAQQDPHIPGPSLNDWESTPTTLQA